MKQIIRDVLDDMSTGQINLGSEAARRVITDTITAALKTKGSYKEYTDYELDEQKARESWVCTICGKSTYELDYDYIGHEEKVFDEYAEDIDEQAFAQGRGSSLYEDPGDGSLQLVTEEEKEQMWIDKLAEEVVSKNDTGYIYESPDGGKTVYKRKEGSDKRELVKDWKTISGQSKAK